MSDGKRPVSKTPSGYTPEMVASAIINLTSHWKTDWASHQYRVNKQLDYSGASGITRIPSGFVYITPDLTNLDLNSCEDLVMLPSNLGDWQKLKALNLAVCNKLKHIPRSILVNPSLEALFINNPDQYDSETRETLQSLVAKGVQVIWYDSDFKDHQLK